MIFDSTPGDPNGESVTFAELRKDYSLAGLAEKDLARDPFRQFEKWFQEAEAAKIGEPNAMTLATATREGRPSARTVLLKGLDGRGFVFFSNYESRKGRELEVTPQATLVFPWLAIERQVEVEGAVTWVSQQSAIIPGRGVLEASLKMLEQKYAGEQVPVPPHWGGWRLVPETVEFWQGRRSRLHDRLRYRRVKDGWTIERLAP